MNSQERFLSIMNFESTDRTLKWEYAYWAGAIKRWYREGLTKKVGFSEGIFDGDVIIGEGAAHPEEEGTGPEGGGITDRDVHGYFGFDENSIQLPLRIYPPREPQVLEAGSEYRIVIDEYGIKKRERIDKQSMPEFLDFPVKNRVDFEKLKEEWKGIPLEERFPADWDKYVQKYKNRTFPLAVGGYPIGFYGTARFMLGDEEIMYKFYDEPTLIKDIINLIADTMISVWGKALRDIKVDFAVIWEDMCFRSGPLISPAMFKEFLLPAYKNVTGFLKDMGVDIVLVDSDGDITSLIPLWLEGGVTGLYPFEVQAGMDVARVREAFPYLQMTGGIDKKAIAKGKDAINEELKKIDSILSKGGFIPFIDHCVPPDISWRNFVYYRNKLNDLIDTAEI